MKKIKEEVKSYNIFYEAVDGTKFYNEDECMKYEASAIGVLKGRLSKLIIGKESAWTLLGESDDNNVLAVKVGSQADVDTILQLYFMENPRILEDDYKDRRELYENMLSQALAGDGIMLLGLNCENELYIIDTKKNMLNRLMKFGSNKE